MAFTPLDQPVQFVKGVGPKRAEQLSRLGIGTARDRQVEQLADMYAFVLSQAGAAGFRTR